MENWQCKGNDVDLDLRVLVVDVDFYVYDFSTFLHPQMETSRSGARTCMVSQASSSTRVGYPNHLRPLTSRLHHYLFLTLPDALHDTMAVSDTVKGAVGLQSSGGPATSTFLAHIRPQCREEWLMEKQSIAFTNVKAQQKQHDKRCPMLAFP